MSTIERITSVLTSNNISVSNDTKLVEELVKLFDEMIAENTVIRTSTKRLLSNELVVLVRTLHNQGVSYNKISRLLLLKHNIDMTGDAIRSICVYETYKDVK